MTSCSRNVEERLPKLRTNQHFRIKSTSRDKFINHNEILSARARHKGDTQQAKRIFSESRHRKRGSMDTAIKIKIAKEELEKRFFKNQKDGHKERKRKVNYEEVKTQGEVQPEQHLFTGRIRTVHYEPNYETLQKMGHVSDPNRLLNRQKLQDTQKISVDSNKIKKKHSNNDYKEPKGKYRCRVNQYVFDHVRRRSNLGKRQEHQSENEFWKNVNESMILAGRQDEEMSKDLRAFVIENFTTE